MGVNNLTASEKACLNTRLSIQKLESTPAGRTNTNGLITALKSDINKRGFRVMSEIGTKGRPQTGDTPVKIEVEFRKPVCGVADQTDANLCDTGDAVTNLHDYAQPTVDRVRSQKRRITLEQFNDLCRSPQQYIGLLIDEMAEIIEDGVNSDLAGLAWAAMGNYEGGTSSTTTAKTVNILNPNGYAQPVAWTSIKTEYRKQKTNLMPIVVGGDIMGTVGDTQMLGGTGANSLNATPNVKVVDNYYDSQLDAVLRGIVGGGDTASHALTWTPGAMQMLEWFHYKGDYEMAKEDYTTTTITVNGMKYDFGIKFSECGFFYDLHMKKHYGLFYIPDEHYAPCYTGNNKLHFVLGCGAFVCADYNL